MKNILIITALTINTCLVGQARQAYIAQKIQEAQQIDQIPHSDMCGMPLLIEMRTPFHEAAENNDVELLRQLIEQVPHLLGMVDRSRCSPLGVAISRNCTEAALLILEQWSRYPESSDLHQAIVNNNIKIAQALLQYVARVWPQRMQAFINQRRYDDDLDLGHALSLAARNQNQEMMQLLFEYGAKPNAQITEMVRLYSTFTRSQELP